MNIDSTLITRVVLQKQDDCYTVFTYYNTNGFEYDSFRLFSENVYGDDNAKLAEEFAEDMIACVGSFESTTWFVEVIDLRTKKVS